LTSGRTVVTSGRCYLIPSGNDSYYRNACFTHSFIYSFIQSVVCLTTGPWSPPKQVPHTVRSSAFFKLLYPLFSDQSS
jgi:hypothetical protein